MLAKSIGNKVNNNGVTCSKQNSLANASSVITLAAVVGQRRIVESVQWSYSAAPIAGNLQITDGVNVYLDLDVTAAGAGGLTMCITTLINTPLTVTLAAGGSGVIGKLAVQSTCESD
jgi:hypothetical protein